MPIDTELHKAGKEGDILTIKELIGDGEVSVNSLGAQNRTALHRALAGGFHDCALTLIELGADSGLKDALRRTCLHYTCLAPEEDPALKCLELLFAHEKSKDAVKSLVNAQTKSGTTALHCAAEKGAVKLARFLLDHGADHNLKDEDGKTSLQVAKDNKVKVPPNFWKDGGDTPRRMSQPPPGRLETRRASAVPTARSGSVAGGSEAKSQACILS